MCQLNLLIYNIETANAINAVFTALYGAGNIVLCAKKVYHFYAARRWKPWIPNAGRKKPGRTTRRKKFPTRSPCTGTAAWWTNAGQRRQHRIVIHETGWFRFPGVKSPLSSFQIAHFSNIEKKHFHVSASAFALIFLDLPPENHRPNALNRKPNRPKQHVPHCRSIL